MLNKSILAEASQLLYQAAIHLTVSRRTIEAVTTDKYKINHNINHL